MLNIFLEVIFMDYFSVIVLVIVIFIFASDRSVKSIDNIIKEKTDINILQEIRNVKEKIDVIKISTKDMHYANILKITKKTKNKYVLLQNSELELTEKDIDTLIANYIYSNKISCGFNLLYVYCEKKWTFKKLYLDIINYLNIFNKKELSTYGVVICAKEDFSKCENKFKKDIVSYTPSQYTHVEFTKDEIKTTKLKRIYISKISEANIDIVIKILLLIISGSIITTNLIYSIFNVNNNINGLIISLVVYYCYSYIIRYIYKPIGKQRVIATYIFPIYFISYIIVGISSLVSRGIKKVQAS